MTDPEFEFFVYEDDFDDPRFSFWLQLEEEGMCLYDRPPEGAGMWLKPDRESDYEPVTPTEDLKRAITDLLGDGLDPASLAGLPHHERYFLQVLHGTVDDNPDAIPAPVWSWMHDCQREMAHADE